MAIADERYVSLTTFRRNGEAVSSPVWIAPLADGTAGFTTGSSSGKVKRIRNNPSVTLRPCDSRGRVPDGTVAVTATATVLTGADAAPIKQAIKAKYGLMVTVIHAMGAVRSVFTRSTAADCVVHLQID